MRSLPILILLCLPLLDLHAQDDQARLAAINDAAAFLAGEELPNQKDHPLTQSASWKSHVSQFGKDFASHQERVLFPMSEWSATEVTPAQPPGAVVRYLFSGPDILHAFHMFPTAGTFILCGLEPVGEAPDISALNEGNVSRALSEVRNALGEIIQLSFFRTKDMKDDLQFATFQGTTPLMMIFLAKSGQYVKELEFFQLNKDGTLAPQGLEHKDADGVRMVFSPRRLDQPKTLYYFSSDLSNGGFDTTGFGTWIAGQPKGSAYLKAASYLMHNDWFSKVREHLLAHSHQIIEDDSGIPFRRFDPAVWNSTLYGVYTGTIDLFKDEFQSDLVTAYRAGSQPLGFGTGYKWRKGESNLMRFVLKDLPAASAPASPAPTETPAEPPAANPAGAAPEAAQ
ncbi:MAG: hypothetical protein KDN18_10740 [Verrucomicrobiae bacterium]|nr:hypothetical protein [Verrucomicrobiae bacterium]